MNNIWTIMKKELKRIFTDRRILASLILPGVLIYLIYSLMGTFMTNQFTTNDDYEYNVVIFNEPEQYKELYKSFAGERTYKVKVDNSQNDLEESKSLLDKGEIDLIIYFDENFSEKVDANKKPMVSMFFNSTNVESTEIYGAYSAKLSEYAITPDIHFNIIPNDVATDEDNSIQIIKLLVPMLLVIFLFSGSMSVSTESIAGEKERGTIATLLVTPVKRSEIALGKVLSLSIASLLSSLSSFLGVIFSFPKLTGGIEGLTLSMYGLGTYFEILILMIIAVIFFTVLLSIVSTFAKSVKEASQYALPVMVVVMVLSFTSMTGIAESTFLPIYFIPVLNIIQCMSNIFSLTTNLLAFIITIISNIIYIILGIYLLTKMFNSEEVMFNK